jgi:hypothetical protein
MTRGPVVAKNSWLGFEHLSEPFQPCPPARSAGELKTRPTATLAMAAWWSSALVAAVARSECAPISNRAQPSRHAPAYRCRPA